MPDMRRSRSERERPQRRRARFADDVDDGRTSDQDSHDHVHRDLLSQSSYYGSAAAQGFTDRQPYALPHVASGAVVAGIPQGEEAYEYDPDVLEASMLVTELERQESQRQEAADAMIAVRLQEEEEARAQAERDARNEQSEAHLIRDERERLVHQLLQIYTADAASPVEVPPVVPQIPEDNLVSYQAPPALPQKESRNFSMVPTFDCDANDVCAVCYEPLETGVAVSLHVCSHLFHLDCISEALNHQRGCPTCRTDVRTIPAGKSPSGTMFITRQEIGAAVVERPDVVNPMVIKIEYKIPPGKQASYHESPGDIYEGTKKVAYLPNTALGSEILRRLMYAFSHGLTFRIAGGEVMWGSIPHLAFLGEKEEDATQLACCTEELDQLGIPRNPDLSRA